MPGFMSLTKELNTLEKKSAIMKLMEWAFEPFEKTIKEAEEKLVKEQKPEKPQVLRKLKWKD